MSEERLEPWLVYLHGGEKPNVTKLYSLPQRRHNVINIPGLRSTHKIDTSSHGWLVITVVGDDDCEDDYLLNPVTMEKIQLPKWPGPDLAYAFCTLSSPPHDRSCVVMYILDTDQKVFLYCKPGDESWTRQEVQAPCNCPAVGYNFDAITSINNEIYGLTICCQSLVKFQFGRDHNDHDRCNLRLLDLNVRKPNQTHHFIRTCATICYSMVQCSPTELIVVEVHYGDEFLVGDSTTDVGCMGIELYKVNLRDQVCGRMESLPGDSAIFLGASDHTAVYYKIPRDDLDSGRVRGNTIYFTERNDKYLYAYDVQERSVSVSLPCPDVKCDYGGPYWIQLPVNWSLMNDPQQPQVVASEDDSPNRETPSIEANKIASKLQIMKRGGGVRDWWSDLLNDILYEIQSLLFGADRCYFRLACKTWKSSFSNSTSESGYRSAKLQKIHQFPILMHIGNDGELVNFFNPIMNSTHTLPLLGLTGAIIRCSKDGWLLITQGSTGEKILFLNPFTNERIDLPDLDEYIFDGITFSSLPASSDCMVLGYSNYEKYTLRLHFIYRGESEWSGSDVQKNGVLLDNSYSNPVYHQGLFYLMGKAGNLCIHDPGGRTEQSTSKVIDLARKPSALTRTSQLMECEGKLLSVCTGHMGKPLEVYEMNQESMAWEELDSLDDTMLFFSYTSLLSATTSGVQISGLGNKVFLDRFSRKDGVFYSLKTRKFHTFWSGYNSDDWCDTKKYTNCAWIVPNFETHKKGELQWFDPAIQIEQAED
ncbi:unnamed protein product [Linum tenue]|uniref:KIB1-4 beta-propeller domain-containing protein n=1 Tax=Linum tenue TaxID=586396 RepID=A0AAV0R132_9ROSI|nr:unnamed protein product [Linum tenue]